MTTTDERAEETPPEPVGLTDAEARRRLAVHGPNEVARRGGATVLGVVVGAFRSPLVWLLVVAVVFDLVVWWTEGRSGVPIESIAIAAILVVNAALDVAQSVRAERALATLETLAVPRVHVWRGGVVVGRPATELVPGDVVEIAAGDGIPADGRWQSAEGVKIDASTLTGESVPEDAVVGDDAAAGTWAIAGAGRMTVTATGAASTLGRLSILLGTVRRGRTPLQVRLERFGTQIAVGVVALATALATVGIALGGRVSDVASMAVALAVAAVPEGLPAVITGALALGTQRMARRRAVVRRLAAVETLGVVDVIATDKTGTLTENRMSVAAVIAAEQGHANGAPIEGPTSDDRASALLRAAVLASDAPTDGQVGDPLERAVIDAYRAAGHDPTAARRRAPRVSHRPFDARWSYLRSTVDEQGTLVTYMKGSPEAILAACDVGDATKQAWLDVAHRHASDGERSLMVASGSGERERGLTPLGAITFLDPPRASARATVANVRQAGTRIVMITGDHPATAAAIARRVGLNPRRIVVGDEVPDLLARGEVASVDLFARTSPDVKLAIVRALREQGSTVAMTGDGVNDAPALRQADVGVAMGRRGSDVAREAADLVLLDDDLATLVEAIREGRNVSANVRAFVRFLFAANLAEVLALTASFVWASWAVDAAPGEPGGGARFVVPLTAAQILWINLVTDALPALALALDRRCGLLRDTPRDADAPLLAGATARFVAVQSVVLALLAVAPRAWMPWIGLPTSDAPAATFAILALGQLALIDGARRERTRLKVNLFLIAAVAIGTVLVVIPAALDGPSGLLGGTPLPIGAWPGVVASVAVAWASARAWAAWESHRHVRRTSNLGRTKQVP